jgi:SAM-dependent methyltransferase
MSKGLLSATGIAIEMNPAPPNDPKARAAFTYNAIDDFFDAPPLAFWDRIGRRSVEKASLRPGAYVLNVCCGSGASAIPAAEVVGPTGRVVGVDLAENLLSLARSSSSNPPPENVCARSTLAYLSQNKGHSVATNAVCAIARKPSSPSGR